MMDLPSNVRQSIRCEVLLIFFVCLVTQNKITADQLPALQQAPTATTTAASSTLVASSATVFSSTATSTIPPAGPGRKRKAANDIVPKENPIRAPTPVSAGSKVSEPETADPPPIKKAVEAPPNSIPVFPPIIDSHGVSPYGAEPFQDNVQSLHHAVLEIIKVQWS